MPVPPHQAHPYAELSEPGYVQHVATHFELKPYGKGSLLAVGPCPRCAADLEIPVVRSTVRGLLFWRDRAPADPVEVPMTCTCEEEHQGRPEEAEGRGCGAFWLLRVPKDLA